MRGYIRLMCLLLAFYGAWGQEEEYYKTPDRRKGSHEVENLPHLASAFSSFYIGLTGGLRKPYHSSSAHFGDFGSTTSPLNEWVEINVGLNMDNAFFIETGLVRLRNQFQTQVYSSAEWPSFLLSIRNQQWYIPVTAKKRVLTLNRITKNAYINVGAGGGVLIGTRPKGPLNYAFDVPFESPYLERFHVTLAQSQSPIYGELVSELKGNVTDRLEIIVFFKGIFRKSSYLSNAFEVKLVGEENLRHNVFEKSGSFVFGLQARFNSRKFYRYTSRI